MLRAQEEFTGGPEDAAAARAARAGGSSILDEATVEDGDAALWGDYGTRESRQKENTAKPSRWGWGRGRGSW